MALPQDWGFRIGGDAWVRARGPDGTRSTGPGATDYAISAIYSTDLLQSLHAEVNVGLLRFGAAPCTSRLQRMWAVAVSDSLTGLWGVTGELSGRSQADVGDTGQVLVAVTFSPSARSTWDFGVVHGWTPATSGWSVLAGLTCLATHW